MLWSFSKIKHILLQFFTKKASSLPFMSFGPHTVLAYPTLPPLVWHKRLKKKSGHSIYGTQPICGFLKKQVIEDRWFVPKTTLRGVNNLRAIIFMPFSPQSLCFVPKMKLIYPYTFCWFWLFWAIWVDWNVGHSKILTSPTKPMFLG